jgi:ribosomal protein S8
LLLQPSALLFVIGNRITCNKKLKEGLWAVRMVQAYNFLASWQLFPEKCDFQSGIAPKSGICKIESIKNGHELSFSTNWVSIENEAFYTQYDVKPDGELRPFTNQDLADSIKAEITNASTISTLFYKVEKLILEVVHEIMPNGYLKITQKSADKDGKPFINVEVYHKQMSVLPYASSVGGVAIRPTKAGVIKHKALAAMDEQTNMQLDQIKQQIELLAKQAQEIRKRKELSLMIYEAQISFKPQIGQIYHLYEKKDSTHVLSLVAPTEWGGSGPFKSFIASVRLLADHTWKEINPEAKKTATAEEDLFG